MRWWVRLLGRYALTPDDAAKRLADAVNDQVKGDVHHVVLAVDAPALGVSGAWASGEASDGVEMKVDTPFLSASVGKLFTAAAVLSIAARGDLALDDAVTKYIPIDVLSGLPVVGGDPAFGDITVAMLLAHRSGLPDFFEDETVDGSPNVLKLLLSEPDRVWTRDDLLGYTRDHFAPIGFPGEVFHYADTNYELLGLVLESVTGKSWHDAIRVQVLDPLGLEQTWYHQYETGPDIAHAWVGDIDVGGAPALSLDQAGGGLATTVSDLVTFSRALEAGNPISRSRFEVFTDDAIIRGIDYGYGLWRIRPKRVTYGFANLPEMVGVSGATGSFVYYVPEYDAVVAGTFDQTNQNAKTVRFLISKVLGTLSRIQVR